MYNGKNVHGAWGYNTWDSEILCRIYQLFDLGQIIQEFYKDGMCKHYCLEPSFKVIYLYKK